MTVSLKTLAGSISSGWRRPSTCEACGNQFSCGASLAGCWCSEIKLSEEARAELRARYRNCLCRECLEGAANRAAGRGQATKSVNREQ